MLVACLLAEGEEKEDFDTVSTIDDSAEIETFLAHSLVSDDEEPETNDKDWEDHFLDETQQDTSSGSSEDLDDVEINKTPKARRTTRSWVKSCSSTYALEKLIRILNGEAYVPRQRWSIDRILATLVTHRNEPRLSTANRQFKRFPYQTMIIETDKSFGRWPGALNRKDVDFIIKLRLQDEIQKRYGKEIQTLCKTSAFGMITNSCPGEINHRPLESIVNDARTKAPLLSSLVIGVGPSSSSSTYSHLVSMKIVAILVILCHSAHRNKSNYIPLLIALYLYSAGARVDAINLLNHFGLSVS